METLVFVFSGFLESGKTNFINETLRDPNFSTGEKTLLYTAALAETIIRIYSCGLGFVARYENAETMQSTFVPLRLVS